MIGTKTLIAIVLLAVATAFVGVGGYWDAAKLLRLGPTMALLLGVFACLTGNLLVRVWRLDQPSATGLRFAYRHGYLDMGFSAGEHLAVRSTLAPGSGQAPWDLVPVARRLIYVVLFLWLGLVAVDDLTIERLQRLPQRISLETGRFCDDAKDNKQDHRLEAQGCELVRRAYRLGFAKSLGDCEPRAKDRDQGPCTLRQRDEPYLHYAWRLLTSRLTSLSRGVGPSAIEAFAERFGRQLAYLGPLYDAQRQSAAEVPRASHHLWTNLPAPRRSAIARVAESVRPGHCRAQTSRAGDRWSLPGKAGNRSLLLERAFGQLLFDPRYKPIVGVCNEYTIHWNAPADACRRLAEDPLGFLESSGARDRVLQVLGRSREQQTLRKLDQSGAIGALRLARPRAFDPLRSHQRVVSFQCYIQPVHPCRGATCAPQLPSLSYRHFTLAGHRFTAGELRVEHTGVGRNASIRMARQLASLLAPGFYYGRLTSEASSMQRDEEGIPFASLFKGRDFLLSKVEYLRGADLFLGEDQLGGRADLYEVYPYHLHTKTFVEVFRRQYTLRRGRL